jgi:hypothetical protein
LEGFFGSDAICFFLIKMIPGIQKRFADRSPTEEVLTTENSRNDTSELEQ